MSVLILLFWFPVALLVFSVVRWWLWFKFSNYCRLLKRIPGPDPLPIIGNTLEILGGCEVLLKIIHIKWPEQYGEIFRFFVALSPGVMVSSPEYVEAIVNNPLLLDKSVEYNNLHSWLGLGLLTSSGAKWKARRRMLTPAFHFHIMEDFFETFNEQSAILCSKIDQLCSHGKSEINVEKLTSHCTLDIICETAMGCPVNAQKHESEYVKAVHSIAIIVMQKPHRLWNRIDAIYDATPDGKEHTRCLRIIRKFTQEVIMKRRQEKENQREDFEEDTKRRKPFLDLLLEASVDGEPLSDEDINDEVNTFMFEGHDTTAATMNWFLYCMAANPECQERVVKELEQVFGHSDRPCSRQDLAALKYLECCIKETLRLHPAVPVFLRHASESVTIGKYELPADSKVGVSVYALHRNPRIYPDPLVFNPDRFSPEQSIGRHPYAFIPFSAGPRNCIGQRFAMSEEKVVLSSLLRRFKFELSPTAKMPRPSAELTLKSSTGFTLLVSRR